MPRLLIEEEDAKRNCKRHVPLSMKLSFSHSYGICFVIWTIQIYSLNSVSSNMNEEINFSYASFHTSCIERSNFLEGPEKWMLICINFSPINQVAQKPQLNGAQKAKERETCGIDTTIIWASHHVIPHKQQINHENTSHIIMWISNTTKYDIHTTTG